MTPNPQSESIVHNSLGLQALCQTFAEGAPCDILELGPARSDSVRFWSRFQPSIYVADLRSILPLPALPAQDEPELSPRDWERLLDLPAGRTFNVILAWDLFNYMELADISGLMGRLRPYCRSGAVLFTLIMDQKQMPEDITVYRIVDEAHLAYEHGGSAMRDCPRHQPRAIAGIMAGFRTANSFRLRNGIVEYLFAYEGEESSMDRGESVGSE